ncbi:hypothetical protein RCL1_007160 [Eukaryota sp. TZLM3-RCL]
MLFFSELDDSYELLEEIGSGSFAKVVKAIHKVSRQTVAIKIIDKSSALDPDDLVRVTRELRLLRKIDSPYIIRLLDVLTSSNTLYIVQEYISGGELSSHITSKGFLSDEESGKIFFEVVEAISYCHSRKLVHRDLKPENILLDANGHVRVIDFGLSNIVKKYEMLTTSCGSPNYASPELISGQSYSYSVDCWALGVLLYCLVSGRLPFEDASTPLLYYKIVAGKFTYEPHVSSEARYLIDGLLTTNVNDRFGIDEIIISDFYQKYCSQLKFQQIRRPLLSVAVFSDTYFVSQIRRAGLNLADTKKAVKEGKRDSVTATCWLILQKMIEEGHVIEKIDSSDNNEIACIFSRSRSNSLVVPVRSRSSSIVHNSVVRKHQPPSLTIGSPSENVLERSTLSPLSPLSESPSSPFSRHLYDFAKTRRGSMLK